MKLSPYLYNLNTFNILSNEGVNEWAGGWRNQKTTRKCHEIKRISTLTSSKTSLEKPNFCVDVTRGKRGGR